jgi:hypothetical protein
MTKTPKTPKTEAQAGTIFWHSVTGGDKKYETVEMAFRAFGFKVPEPTSPVSAFGGLVNEYREARPLFLRRQQAAAGILTADVVSEDPKTPTKYLEKGQIKLDVKNQVLSYTCKNCGSTGSLGFTCCGEYPDGFLDKAQDTFKHFISHLSGSARAAAYREAYRSEGAISLSEHGRPFYMPTDLTKTPLAIQQVIDALKDVFYVLPLRQDAVETAAQLSYEAFFTELKAIEQEVDNWETKTRNSTKTHRLETLTKVQKKLDMYSDILGLAKSDLKGLLSDIETKIQATVLGTAAPAKE